MFGYYPNVLFTHSWYGCCTRKMQTCRNLKEFWSVNYWNSGKGKPVICQHAISCLWCVEFVPWKIGSSFARQQVLGPTMWCLHPSRPCWRSVKARKFGPVISESSRSKPGSLRAECWNSIWTFSFAWRENCIDAKARCECDHNLLRKAFASTSIVTAHIHFWPIARFGRLSPSPFRTMSSRAAVKHEAGETLGQLGIGRTRLTMEIDSFAVLKLHVRCSLWKTSA